MTQKANALALGAFMVGAIILLVAVILWFAGSSLGGDRSRYVMVFDGSVKGLRVGAPVAFKGVDIGQVIEIDLVLNTDTLEFMMPVTVEIDLSRIRDIGSTARGPLLEKLIDKGLRAQLRTQSLLTGLLYIQLDYYPDSTIVRSSVDMKYPEVPTIPTDLQELARILSQIDFPKIIDEVGETMGAIKNLVASPQTQELPARLEETLQQVTGLSRDLRKITPGLEQLVENADGTIAEVRQELPGLMASLQTALQNFDQAAKNMDTVFKELEYSLSGDSPVAYEIIQAAQEMRRAGKALQSLAETIDTQPESLLRGKRQEGD